MQLTLLTILAALAVGGQAVAVGGHAGALGALGHGGVGGGLSYNPSAYGFNPHGGGFGAFGGGGGYGGFAFPKGPTVAPQKPLQLSCSFNHEDGYSVNSLAATIKERRSGYGGGGGGAGNFGGYFTQSFPSVYGGFGKQAGGDGLKAVFELFSSNYKGGQVSVVVTEKGYTAGGCYAENFGKGLSSKGSNGLGQGGYGAGPVGHGGGNFGFASAHQFFAGKGGYGPQDYQPDGVVAQVKIGYGTPKVVSLDRLRDFRSLKQLAGRGLIACTDIETDYHGAAKCVGKILGCCSLSYSAQHH